MRIIFVLLLTVCFCGCGYSNQAKTKVSDALNSEDSPYPVIISVTKKYPEKKVMLQDVADIEYIALETNNETLIDQRRKLAYVSEDRIIVVNFIKGDIFIFDRHGKIRASFNYLGKSDMEYSMISHLSYDPLHKELFIFDTGKRKIFVYSEAGDYQRTLSFPKDMYFEEAYNFNEECLLVFDRFWSKEKNTQPYLFISKEDGSVVSGVGLEFTRKIPNWKTHTISRYESVNTKLSTQQLHKNGEEFLISNISSDTTYVLARDKVLSPIIVRVPSINHATEPYMILSLVKKTDKYILLFKYIMDLDINNEISPSVDVLWHDIHNNETYIPDFIDQNNQLGFPMAFAKTDLPKNVYPVMFNADKLVELLEKGKLSGKLKDIASALGEEDNPVLMLIKFK